MAPYRNAAPKGSAALHFGTSIPDRIVVSLVTEPTTSTGRREPSTHERITVTSFSHHCHGRCHRQSLSQSPSPITVSKSSSLSQSLSLSITATATVNCCHCQSHSHHHPSLRLGGARVRPRRGEHRPRLGLREADARRARLLHTKRRQQRRRTERGRRHPRNGHILLR